MPRILKNLSRPGVRDHPHRKTLRRFECRNHSRALNFSCFRNQPFLRSDRACRWAIDAIEHARRTHPFDLWAYCVMPTHMHLLLYYPAVRELRVSRILASLKRSVTLKATRWARVNRPATLARMLDVQPGGATHMRFWQRGGGYDRNLSSPEAIREMVVYIHRNPVQAGLCVRETDWEWSSARAWAGLPSPLGLDLERFPR